MSTTDSFSAKLGSFDLFMLCPLAAIYLKVWSICKTCFYDFVLQPARANERESIIGGVIFPVPVGNPNRAIYSTKLIGRCDAQKTLRPWLAPVWPDCAIYWTLGNFSKPVATIKSTTFLGTFLKVSKSFIFLVKSFLVTFHWSHCLAHSHEGIAVKVKSNRKGNFNNKADHINQWQDVS